MNEGLVVEQGLKSEVFNPPHPPYTELLLSSVPEMDPNWLDELNQKRKNNPKI
jgi:peptide/nickel transport system ATP-binding protein